MRVGNREKVDGFGFVLAVDRQLEDMLGQLRVVPGGFDLFLISKGSL